MYKLDYKKWRKDLDNAILEKNADMITWLHVIRGHILSKQHRKRARVAWDDARELGKLTPEQATELAANGGSLIVNLSLTDELYFIGEAAKNYTIEIPQPEDVEDLREGWLATLKRIF